MNYKKKILIIGGGGYVGSALCDLLSDDYDVNALDLFIYGDNVFYKNNINLIKGDIRDTNLLEKSCFKVDTIIHLACISNDPSFDLNPRLGKSINFDSFLPLIKIAKKNKVKDLIFASSSSVYGVKKDKNVIETSSKEPLTDYSKYKSLCEETLLNEDSSSFITTILRPATVCGFSLRQRFDVVVNMFVNQAINNSKISVFGGEQLRPNIHIKDMINSYKLILETESKKKQQEIFNVGYENLSVLEIANKVRENIDKNIKLTVIPSEDNRSYFISSKKIEDKLNFKFKYDVSDAIKDLKKAFDLNYFENSLENPIYNNIKLMKSIHLE